MRKLMITYPSDHPIYLQEISAPVLPEYPKLARLKHHHELTGKSLLEEQQGFPPYPQRPDGAIGIPSVEKAMVDNKKNFCYFTYQWQMFSFELIKMRVREVLYYESEANITLIAKKIFFSGYRNDAFQSNKAGTQTHRDYVNDKNSGAEDMKLEPVVTGGNVVKVLEPQRLFYGAVVHKCLCFDGTKPPPDPELVNWHTRPDMVHLATIETRIPTANGKREIRPFEFQGVSQFPYFVLVNGRDYFYFAKDRLIFD